MNNWPHTSFPFYPDVNGQALDGAIWFGESNKNPVTSPSTVYWDKEGTQPAAQPIMISRGRTVRSDGTPSRVWVTGDYSTLVRNKQGQDIVFEPVLPDNFGVAPPWSDSDWIILVDTVLKVPSQYSSIQSAFDYLRGKRINANATVTIEVADGLYFLTSSINLNHPDGDRIRLIGNETSPSSCVLQVLGMSYFDAVYVSNGHNFGYFNGFRVASTSKADLTHNTTGILAVQNATLVCGPNVEVDNFFYGIAARDSSYVYCPYAVVTNAGDVGIWAFCGSTIVANNAQSHYASDTVNNWGYGLQAEFGSVLVATEAQASGNLIAGIASLSNSTARTHNAICDGNTGSGFLSWAGGQIECWGSESTNNGRFGLEITEYGNIIGVGKNENNTLGPANGFAFIGEIGGQALIQASLGNLRVDSQTGTFFHTIGGLQASVENINNAVGFVAIHGAGEDTGNQVGFTAYGSADNIGFRHDSKGTGSHYFNSRGTAQCEIFGTQDAINFVSITGGTAGGAPAIGVSGVSADIDLRLNVKGTGLVILGAFTDDGNGGYIEVKDYYGNRRKLKVTQ
jgi:hypothetical protein